MDSVIKKTGCALLHKSGIIRLAKFNTRILAFHSVNPGYFEEQMSYLKKNYLVVSLQEALCNMNKKQVVLTFDDGYKNNYAHAYPVLKKLGLRATVFITHEFIDRNLFAWWDRLESSGKKINLDELKQKSPVEIEKGINKITGLKPSDKKPAEYDFMSWDEIKKITDVFEIGSHTMNHPILTNISLKEAEKEIIESKKKIEKKINKKIISFAYPNGNYNEEIIGRVKRAGYNCAVIYAKGNNDMNTDKFKLFRRGINIKDNLSVFSCKVAGVF